MAATPVPTEAASGWRVPNGDARFVGSRVGRRARRHEARLRAGAVPVIGRVADDVLLLDLRTVPPRQDDTVFDAVLNAVGPVADARAAFLDRDGTLIVDKHYLHDANAVELVPGAAAGVRRLRSAGWFHVVVTNQSGIAQGCLRRRSTSPRVIAWPR
ncbi:MAG: hypothetical protein U0163_15745 [Gemmatimonadaceae bacterium]